MLKKYKILNFFKIVITFLNKIVLLDRQTDI